MALPKLHNVSNPNSFGIEWEADGYAHQLYATRGIYVESSAYLWFATRALTDDGGRSGRQPWQTMRVIEPERFGFVESDPPRTFAAFRAVAERFTEGSE
jgi:hypothetical protein